MDEIECQHKNQWDRFCSHCGARLKQPCPECGEWEPIGRPVCLTKVNDIKMKLDQFRAFSVLVFLSPIFLAILVLYGIIYPKFVLSIILDRILFYVIPFFCQHLFVSISLFVAVCSIMIITADKLDTWRSNRKKRKLFASHPEYKEILEKAREKI